MHQVIALASGKQFLVPVILFALLCLSSLQAGSQEIPSDRFRLEPKPRTSTIRELSGNETQASEISLSNGQALNFTIEKGDLNLTLEVTDPQGQKIFEQTSRDYEAMEVSLVAAMTGQYRVEVRSLEQEREPRSFKLTIVQIGPATARDIQDSLACKLFADASQLRATWKEAALRKALENYVRAGQVWRAADYRPKAVNALMEAAEVHFILGEYRPALSLYQMASAESLRLGDRQSEMTASSHAGRIYSHLGDNEEAQRRLEQALSYFGKDAQAGEPPFVKHTRAAVLNNMGEVSYSKGELIRARDYLQRALSLCKEVGDRRQEARASLYLGFVSATSSEQEAALTYFNRAAALYQALAHRHGEMLTSNAVAALRAMKGDAQGAVKVHTATLSVFREIGDQQSAAMTLTGIGQDYDILNEKQTALDYYEQALNLFQRNGSLDFASVALYQIAGVYQALGQSQKALDYYQQCIGLSRVTGKRRMEAYALNDMAAIYEAQGKREHTLARYRQVLRLYRAIGDRRGEALTLNSIGDLFSSLKNHRKAFDFYLQAQPLSQASGDPEVEINTLYRLASAARDNGQPENGLSYVQQSITAIELLRSYITSPDLRSSYFASFHKHYELNIDLLMQLEREQPGRGFADAALQACERARARSLIEILTEANAHLRRDTSSALMEAERVLLEKLRVKTQYQLELSSNQAPQTELDEVAREIRQLIAEYQGIQAQVREQDPRYASLTQFEPLSVREIQAKLLDADTVLLEYSLGEERSYLWVVTADSFKSYELPARAALEGAAHEVYTLLTARVPPAGGIDAEYQSRVEAADNQYVQKAQELSRMLLGPVIAELRHKRLLIVSEGILQYVPFDALPKPVMEQDARQGGTDDRASDKAGSENPALLVSTHEIVMLPSILTMVALREQSLRPPPTDKVVAVLADPVFSMQDIRVQRVNDPRPDTAELNAKMEPLPQALRDFNGLTGDGGFPRLQQTLREADLILKAAPPGTGMKVTDFAADREAALNAQLKEYRIIHFATHSLINTEHPEVSGIVLSMVDRTGERKDGFLQLSDIYSMNLSSDLVVLSACNTGLGKNIKGEGLVGLTRGFMYAGSKSVVASLWKVDDQATAELMGYFYQAMLRQQMRPAAALKAAKESLRQQKRWSAPYFWAAFVLQGEYQDPIPVSRRTGEMTGPLILAALLLSTGTLLLLRRRRMIR